MSPFKEPKEVRKSYNTRRPAAKAGAQHTLGQGEVVGQALEKEFAPNATESYQRSDLSEKGLWRYFPS